MKKDTNIKSNIYCITVQHWGVILTCLIPISPSALLNICLYGINNKLKWLKGSMLKTNGWCQYYRMTESTLKSCLFLLVAADNVLTCLWSFLGLLFGVACFLLRDGDDCEDDCFILAKLAGSTGEFCCCCCGLESKAPISVGSTVVRLLELIICGGRSCSSSSCITAEATCTILS